MAAVRLIRQLQDLSFFHLTHLARDVGLFDGHRAYGKFIILGEARSGSNFLRGLLNSHGQVIAFGEIFRFYDSIGWDLEPYDRFWQSKRLRRLFQTDPQRFLNEKVFRRFPRDIAAVGFKIFYYHANNEPHHAIWSYLKNCQELKILHLKRENILRLVLSLKKAFLTNQWEDRHGANHDGLSITLDYDECLQRFQMSEEYKIQYDRFFEGRHTMEIMYERLEHDFTTEMRRIQDFLGVSQRPTIPSIYKQSQSPLAKAISNYYELKEKFQGTRWAGFFEE